MKEYGVEIAFRGEIRGNRPIVWHSWKKYKTQRRMLQGLKNLRENERIKGITMYEYKNGKKYAIWCIFRPVHINN